MFTINSLAQPCHIPAVATAISAGEFFPFGSLVVRLYLKISQVPQETPQQSTHVDVHLLLLKNVFGFVT